MLDDLSRAREGFVLASDLHLVYLVTPTNVEVEPDWELYYERFMELSALERVSLPFITIGLVVEIVGSYWFLSSRNKHGLSFFSCLLSTRGALSKIVAT